MKECDKNDQAETINVVAHINFGTYDEMQRITGIDTKQYMIDVTHNEIAKHLMMHPKVKWINTNIIDPREITQHTDISDKKRRILLERRQIECRTIVDIDDIFTSKELMTMYKIIQKKNTLSFERIRRIIRDHRVPKKFFGKKVICLGTEYEQYSGKHFHCTDVTDDSKLVLQVINPEDRGIPGEKFGFITKPVSVKDFFIIGE